MIDDIQECDEYPSVIPDVGSYWRENDPPLEEYPYTYRVDHYCYTDHTVYLICLEDGFEYAEHGHYFDDLYTQIDDEEIPLLLLAHTGT